MDYRVLGLSPDLFTQLFDLTDEELAARGAVRRIADEPNAFPCRVTLEDAAPGEELLLLPYRHHTGPSPYQSSGPIYVRRAAIRTFDAVNELPAMQSRRLSSVRAYDAAGFLVVAEVVEGGGLEGAVREFLGKREVECLHVHNARPGCYAFRVERARDGARVRERSPNQALTGTRNGNQKAREGTLAPCGARNETSAAPPLNLIKGNPAFD